MDGEIYFSFASVLLDELVHKKTHKRGYAENVLFSMLGDSPYINVHVAEFGPLLIEITVIFDDKEKLEGESRAIQCLRELLLSLDVAEVQFSVAVKD